MITLFKSADIDLTKLFYHSFGLTFKKEKHGSGPEHYSFSCRDALFEIYPESPEIESNICLRIEVSSLATCLSDAVKYKGTIIEPALERNGSYNALIKDPDGRIIRLIQKND